MSPPRCNSCGRFFSGVPYAWRMVYSGGPLPEPDREIYRCARCLLALGAFDPQPGIIPRFSCGIVTTPEASDATV